MRAFFRRHRGLHIWLLSVCGVLALYFALRTVPGLMTRFSRGIIMPLERAVAAVCYRADFSVAELLYAIVAGVVLLWMGATVRRLLTEKGRRGRIVYRFVLTAVCTVLTVYAGFSLLWGVNYYAESFQEQSGVYARESTPEELARVTEYFARQLAGCADQVKRDENGLFAESRADIFAHTVPGDGGPGAQEGAVFHSPQRHGLYGVLFPLYRGGQPEHRQPRLLSAQHHCP